MPTTPPDATAAIGSAASGLSNGIVDGVTDNLQYIVPVLVFFTVIGVLRAQFGAKKK